MASQLAAVRKENAELRRQLAQTRRAARQVEDIPPRVPEGRADEAEESSDASEPPPEFNAVQICGRMMEVYGAPIPNNIALEKRGHLLDAKMKDFLEVIDRAIQVTDLVSGKTLLKNFQEVQDRYLCVFRESGEKLKAYVNLTVVMKFLEVVKLRLPKYQTHFHNYHEVDSIG
mmetsp:Transcript_33880/g.75797  ORF Transcript_33880/g.75797 Transcript_33880/m.75797 type:complete len:173 (-) Transcript_33880:67-585(-)